MSIGLRTYALVCNGSFAGNRGLEAALLMGDGLDVVQCTHGEYC